MLISFPQDIKIEEKEGSLIGFHLSASVWLCRSFFFHSFYRFSSSPLMPEFRPGVALSRCPGWALQGAGVWGGGGVCVHAGEAEVRRAAGAWGTPTPAEQLARGSQRCRHPALPRQPAGSASSRPPHLPDSWQGNKTPAIFRERDI